MKTKTALSSILIAMFLALVLSGSVLAADDGGGQLIQAPADSNCFVSNGTPGCDDAECEGIVSAVDPFCTNISWDSICANEATQMCNIDGAAPDVATFRVHKDFLDNNTAEVEVTMTCTGGLPLKQSFEVSPDRGVVFTLEAFTDGQPTCTIEEVVPAGYEATYSVSGSSDFLSEPCSFQSVTMGTAYVCDIRNTPVPVEVEVEAVWDTEVADNNVVEEAFASMSCTDTAFGTTSFNWNINGDYTFTANIVPDFDGGTVCNVVYGSLVSAVEGSGCDDPISVTQDGGDQSCTITFTSFFEGIPTINQYGLAILAVLMLSIGVVGFRRFV